MPPRCSTAMLCSDHDGALLVSKLSGSAMLTASCPCNTRHECCRFSRQNQSPCLCMSSNALLLFQVARSLPGLSPLDSGIVLLIFEAATSGLWTSDTAVRAIAARQSVFEIRRRVASGCCAGCLMRKACASSMHDTSQKPLSAADPCCFGSDSLQPIHAAFAGCD